MTAKATSNCDEANQFPFHHRRYTMPYPLHKVSSQGRLRPALGHTDDSTGNAASGTLTTALGTLTKSISTGSDADTISIVSMSDAGKQGDKQGAVACLCRADDHGDAIYVVIGTLDGGWKKLSDMKTLLEDMHGDFSKSTVVSPGTQRAKTAADISEIATGTGETGWPMLADNCQAKFVFISALLQFTDGTRILTTNPNTVRLAFDLALTARHDRATYKMPSLRANCGSMELSMLLFLGAEAQPVDVGLLSSRNGRDDSLRMQLEILCDKYDVVCGEYRSTSRNNWMNQKVSRKRLDCIPAA